MPTLDLSFTKLSAHHHRFAYRRPDGGGESRELETRSFLMHDLTHYAVESEAGLQASFYGSLLNGETLDDLAVRAASGVFVGEWGETERIVGALNSGLRPDVDTKALAARLVEFMHNMSEEPPAYLTSDVLAAALKRLRQLTGQWKATPFGATLHLAFTRHD